MKKDSSTPAHFKSFKEKVLKKTTDLYSSIECYPDQEELLSFFMPSTCDINLPGTLAGTNFHSRPLKVPSRKNFGTLF
jgi:hypothetical protein